ncbi:MAG: hypothetical protein IJ127_28065, partial [Afipia sp.]|nr:hypothetical protein [Afipia sp.]
GIRRDESRPDHKLMPILPVKEGYLLQDIVCGRCVLLLQFSLEVPSLRCGKKGSKRQHKSRAFRLH